MMILADINFEIKYDCNENQSSLYLSSVAFVWDIIEKSISTI